MENIFLLLGISSWQKIFLILACSLTFQFFCWGRTKILSHINLIYENLLDIKFAFSVQIHEKNLSQFYIFYECFPSNHSHSLIGLTLFTCFSQILFKRFL